MAGERTVKIKFDGDAKGAVRAGQQTEGALLGVDKQTDTTSRSANKLDKAYGSATRSVIRDLEKMEQQAFESGDGMDKAFTDSLKSMRTEVARLTIEAKRSGDTLDSELGGALLKVRQQADQLGESLRKGVSDGGSGGGGGGGGGGFLDGLLDDIPKGKAGFLAGGAALGGALFAGLKSEWAEDKVGGLLAAQQGAAASQAERLGNIAGNTFAGSFTAESVEAVGEAMGALFDSSLISTDAPEAAIDTLTDKILTLEATTGATANEIAVSVKQLLVTGMAGSASQAMDIIEQAAELGLNRFGDLTDTVQEYSTSWREVGLVGPEALGLIKQATDAGARNTDLAADAIKEFGIRAQDASATTSRGFQTLGLDAEKMGQAVARGGQPAKQALGEVLDALNEMPPGIERSQAAVDLFGTQAEDLGDALFAMDLDDAASQFGEFAGSVEEAAQKIADSQSVWDKIDKNVSDLVNNIGEGLDKFSHFGGGEMDALAAKGREFALAQKEFLSSGATSGFDDLKKKYSDLSPAIDEYISKNRGSVDVQREEKTATEQNIETLDKMLEARNRTAEATSGLAHANLDWFDAIDSANAALEKNGATLDATTEKGRDNTTALYGIADSALAMADKMNGAGRSVSDVNGFLTTAQDQFIKTATDMGLPIDQARQLAQDLGLIPKTVFTKVELQAQNAIDAAARYKAMIESIPKERWTVLNTIVGTGVGDGGGHNILRATGGPVQAGKSYLVGERGPEILQMPNSSSGNVIPNHALSSSPSVDVQVFLDGKALDARVETKIRENNRDIRRAAGSRTRG